MVWRQFLEGDTAFEGQPWRPSGWGFSRSIKLLRPCCGPRARGMPAKKTTGRDRKFYNSPGPPGLGSGPVPQMIQAPEVAGRSPSSISASLGWQVRVSVILWEAKRGGGASGLFLLRSSANSRWPVVHQGSRDFHSKVHLVPMAGTRGGVRIKTVRVRRVTIRLIQVDFRTKKKGYYFRKS